MPLLLGLFASNKKETDPFWRACQGLREAVLINPQEEGTVPIHRVYPRLWEKKMKSQSPQSPPHSGWESGGSPSKRRGWPWLRRGLTAVQGLSLRAAGGGCPPAGAHRLSGWRLPSVQSSGSRVCRSPYLQHGGLGRCSRRTPEQRLGTGSTRAQLLLGLWDLPGPGVEPVSPALAGGFFTPWATREAQQGCFFFSFLFCRVDYPH